MLDRARSSLLVIDLQEAYRGKLHEEARVVAAAQRMLRAVAILGLPVFVTEQYPKGLGATRSEIEELLPTDAQRFEKTSFSCLGAPGLRDRFRSLADAGRDQVVVLGIETHVCVSQTIHELLAERFTVHAVRDATTARFPFEDEVGWAQLVGAGAIPTSSEAALFQWLRDARAAEFKAIHRLVV